jgi:hypothetical protein
MKKNNVKTKAQKTFMKVKSKPTLKKQIKTLYLTYWPNIETFTTNEYLHTLYSWAFNLTTSSKELKVFSNFYNQCWPKEKNW